MKNWEKFQKRALVLKAIRDFFSGEKFLEVETPLLLPAVIPESYLDLFTTSFKDRKNRKHPLFLAPSPEVSIKKLLSMGIGNCFEIGKSFRNGETGSRFHNPEFTMLEWYRVGVSYREIMQDCENLLLYIYKALFRNKDTVLTYQGKKVDLSPPWERISVADALLKYAAVPIDDLCFYDPVGKDYVYPVAKIREIAGKKGYSVSSSFTWEEYFHQIFFNEVEPFLGTNGRPTIIYDYPKPLSALAKTKDSNPRFAERFEFYINGLELGDCYSELTDGKKQRARFKEEMEIIKKDKNKTKVVPDGEFLKAVSLLPVCAGIAVGVDRLVMLFTDAVSIEEVLLFPLSGLIGFEV